MKDVTPASKNFPVLKVAGIASLNRKGEEDSTGILPPYHFGILRSTLQRHTKRLPTFS